MLTIYDGGAWGAGLPKADAAAWRSLTNAFKMPVSESPWGRYISHFGIWTFFFDTSIIDTLYGIMRPMAKESEMSQLGTQPQDVPLESNPVVEDGQTVPESGT